MGLRSLGRAETLHLADNPRTLHALGEAAQDAGIGLILFAGHLDNSCHWFLKLTQLGLLCKYLDLFHVSHVFSEMLDLDGFLRAVAHIADDYRAFHRLLLPQNNRIRHF